MKNNINKKKFVLILGLTLMLGLVFKKFLPQFQVIPSAIFGIVISMAFSKTELFHKFVNNITKKK